MHLKDFAGLLDWVVVLERPVEDVRGEVTFKRRAQLRKRVADEAKSKAALSLLASALEATDE